MNLELVDPFELHAELPEVIEAKLDDGDVGVCAFSRRGNLLAGGCRDGKLLVWDFGTHNVARVFEGHTANVVSVAWTRSSRRLFSASADGVLLVWEVLTGSRLAQVNLGVPVHLAALHPRKRDLCLACVANLLLTCCFVSGVVIQVRAGTASPPLSPSSATSHHLAPFAAAAL